MKITLQASEIQADEGRRIISGKILPFENEVGYTNVGKVKFRKGSVQWDDPKKVKFLLEHDGRKPLGRAQAITADDDALYATFKVSATTRGNDALIEASEDLRSGLSVGVEVLDSRQVGAVLEVLSARLEEVSLVSNPAFKSAEVLEVAASESSEVEEKTNNESEAPVENTPEVVAPEAESTPAVEASRPTITAAVAYAKPRIEVTPGAYLENTVRASMGDDSARQWLAAAADTTDNAGLIPTRQLSEVINPLSNADRPFIDAISRGTLPDAGMSFEIPKLTQAPSVSVTSEAGTPSETDQNVAFVTVNVQKFAGQQTFSVELLDRSSPAFFAELSRQMQFAYAKATNDRVSTVIGAAATDGGNRTMSAANLLDFISDAAVSVYTNTLGFATNVVVSPEQWGAIMGLVDGSNRPVYVQTINPQNASANLTPTGVRGNLHGLNLYVSRSLSGTGDGTIVVLNPESYTWYESGTFRLESNVIASGQISVALYGYGAIATKVAAGAYKWMVA
jgi:HK97 family phage major capsid protein